MKINLLDAGLATHARLFTTRVCERIPAALDASGMTVRFVLDPALGAPESYRIDEINGGWQVAATDELGLYFGIGKLLHSASWSKDTFTPVPTNGVISPASSYRAIYYSKHFYNWYQVAPVEEQERYLEDLLLWGYNVLHTTLPTVNATSFDDPIFTDAIEQTHRVFKLAKKLGLKTSLSVGSNQGLKSAPAEFDAEMSFDLTLRGNLGRNLCINKPGVREYFRDLWSHKLQCFTDVGLDFITCWPYDEGGCGCEKCRPWGKNGYGETCRLAAEVARSIFPEIKVIASTWAFDAPNDEGEYAGFYQRLATDLADAVDYIMVDAHGDFPRYPLEHAPVKPVVNFPEISMWGLAPWGGFGANPLPLRFQRIWDSAKHVLAGGMPYSEGLYEDISKIQCVGYYWAPDKKYDEILGEYIAYEYSDKVVQDTLELMRLIEINHTNVAEGRYPELDLAKQALALAERINEALCARAKTAWRWRILYIRAMLDVKRYAALLADTGDDPKKLERSKYFSGDYLLHDEQAQALFLELWGYYHCLPHNGENHHTLPPYGGTKLDVVV